MSLLKGFPLELGIGSVQQVKKLERWGYWAEKEVLQHL